MLMHIPQCTSDDDVTHYKKILRQWIYALPSQSYPEAIYQLGPATRWPPCSHRYLAMAYVDSGIISPDHVWISMRPETAADARETAEWLNTLLHRIYTEVCWIGHELDFYLTKLSQLSLRTHHNTGELNELLQKWMAWAISNNVPWDSITDR